MGTIISIVLSVGVVGLLIYHLNNKAKIKAKIRAEERERQERDYQERIRKCKEHIDKYGLEELEIENLILGIDEVCYYSADIKFRKILKTKHEVYSGKLYLTNKQFIFNSPASKLSKNIQDIVYIDVKNINREIIHLQIGKSWYEVVIKDAKIFEIILREALNQYKENSPKFSRRLICSYCGVENFIESRAKEIKCVNCGAPLKRKELK